MLVSLSGRKGSGKSLLAEELVKRGFKRVGFADYLKKSVAELYNWDVSWLYHPEKKEELLEEKVRWDEDVAKKFSKIVGEDIPVVCEAEFETIRESLTHIGTSVLREIDPDFHVKKTLGKLEKDKNYVCDDARYLNEINLIKSIPRNISVFVIRPFNFNYSNHSSEVSLNRKHFKNIIINDGTKEDLIVKFSNLIENNICKVDLPECNNDAFFEPNKYSAFWVGALTNCLVAKKNSLEVVSTNKNMLAQLSEFIGCNDEIDDGFSINSPYIIEDLKMWNVYDNKTPHCIKDNQELLRYWNEGRQCR